MRKKLEYLIIIFIGSVSAILNYFGIRSCVFFNLTGCPCPGCGLTRSIINVFKLNIKKSISYNILGIPVLIFIISYIFFRKKLEIILKKYQKIIIPLIVILVIISWCINLQNKLLYEKVYI